MRIINDAYFSFLLRIASFADATPHGGQLLAFPVPARLYLAVAAAHAAEEVCADSQQADAASTPPVKLDMEGSGGEGFERSAWTLGSSWFLRLRPTRTR